MNCIFRKDLKSAGDIARGMVEEILYCGFAKQKLQQRLGTDSPTRATQNREFYRKYSGAGLAQIKM